MGDLDPGTPGSSPPLSGTGWSLGPSLKSGVALGSIEGGASSGMIVAAADGAQGGSHVVRGSSGWRTPPYSIRTHSGPPLATATTPSTTIAAKITASNRRWSASCLSTVSTPRCAASARRYSRTSIDSAMEAASPGSPPVTVTNSWLSPTRTRY